MFSLSDSKWRQFRANYTNGEHVAELLDQAESGRPLEDWYDELFQELCHQYTVSEAAYPAALHLVRIASSHPELREELLVLLGSCHAFSTSTTLATIPEEVVEAWRSSAKMAIPLIVRLLEQPHEDESSFRYLLSSLAAVHGYPDLASAIEGLDTID